MDLLKDCPECGKPLSKSKKYCSCGWQIAVIKECQVVDRNCAYLTSEGRCKNMGSIAPHGSDGKWYCSTHWYEAINGLKK